METAYKLSGDGANRVRDFVSGKSPVIAFYSADVKRSETALDILSRSTATDGIVVMPTRLHGPLKRYMERACNIVLEQMPRNEY